MFFLNMGQSRPLFVYFRPSNITFQIQIEKSVDVVLGIRTRGRRMVGPVESTELRLPSIIQHMFFKSVDFKFNK